MNKYPKPLKKINFYVEKMIRYVYIYIIFIFSKLIKNTLLNRLSIKLF